MNLGHLQSRGTDDTCGSWRRPDWKPSAAWFRCSACGAVVPVELWDGCDTIMKLCKECNR